MEKINVKELNDNVFETIGKEWMLVCAGNKDHFNMMTASWGCLGWLWNKPVAVVFIRPERFTHGIIEENEFMTLSFLGNSEEARKIYSFCGSKSGRDLDKVKETGLIPVETDNGCIGFECRGGGPVKRRRSRRVLQIERPAQQPGAPGAERQRCPNRQHPGRKSTPAHRRRGPPAQSLHGTHPLCTQILCAFFAFYEVFFKNHLQLCKKYDRITCTVMGN